MSRKKNLNFNTIKKNNKEMQELLLNSEANKYINFTVFK